MRFTSRRLETLTVGALGRGLCASHRPLQAADTNHAGGWVSGALVRFGSLDFIVTIGGGPEQIRVSVCPVRTSCPDPGVEAFKGMRLRAPEDRASKVSGPLDFDYESLGCQLRVFLGPRLTRRTYASFYSRSPTSRCSSPGENHSPRRSCPGMFR
jgi:hypothetical protein